MTDAHIDNLEHALQDVRRRAVQGQPVATEIGYALKSLAQWRSLDKPEAQRRAVTTELVAAAEECLAVVDDSGLVAALRAYETAEATASRR